MKIKKMSLEEKIAEEIIFPFCGYNPIKNRQDMLDNPNVILNENEFYDKSKDLGYRKVEENYYYVYMKKPDFEMNAPDGYIYNFGSCEIGVPLIIEDGELKIKSKVYGSDKQWGLIISPKGYAHPFVGSARFSEETDFCLDGDGDYYKQLKNKNLSLVDQVLTTLFNIDLILSDGYFGKIIPRQTMQSFKEKRTGRWSK